LLIEPWAVKSDQLTLLIIIPNRQYNKPIPEHTSLLKETGIKINIQTKVPGILSKEEQNNVLRRIVTLSYLNERYL
jgi:hypothetical protein